MTAPEPVAIEVVTRTVESLPAADEVEAAQWPDESAESAYRAEARERGEPVAVSAAPEKEEADAKALPPLDELVQRIPPAVRETLDELFRARFVTVKRVPKRAFKS